MALSSDSLSNQDYLHNSGAERLFDNVRKLWYNYKWEGLELRFEEIEFLVFTF